jgi:NAD(P)-dependent dehydrogenase (short-subunit alcohol dehydrogenase family)
VMDFRGERVLVTGGSSGIGLETARAFVASGARVWIAARDEERLSQAAASTGAEPLVADVSTAEGARELLAEVGRQADGLDVLVNCAGQFEVGRAEELGTEMAERLVQVNYLGSVRTIQAALPLLRRGERRSIVTLSSIAGRVAPPFFSAYSGSKFALHGYCHALRQELRPEGFHVGLVLPGPVDTVMIAGKYGTDHYPPPPFMPKIAAGPVAAGVLRCVRRRRREVVIPSRLAAIARLAGAFPELVDLAYRWLARRGLRERSRS